MRSWSHVSLPMAALFLLQLFQDTHQLEDVLPEEGHVEISTLPTPEKANYSRCVGEWKYYPDTNSCYKLMLDPTNYAKQEEICNAIGGILAVIDTDEKLTFFTKSFHLGDEFAFIGARVTLLGIQWADGTFMTRLYARIHMNIHYFWPPRDGCVVITGQNVWIWSRCEISLMAACEITDVDKCIENNGDCDHMCQSIMGDKSCLCRPNYYLKNQTSCEVENPCQISNGGCSHICKNPRRGESVCSCKQGYKTRPNGQCHLDNFKSMESLNLTRMLLVALILLTVIITSCRYCPNCLNVKRRKKTTSVSSESSADEESDEDSSYTDESRVSTNMIKKNAMGLTEKTVKFEDKKANKKMSAGSSESGSSDSSSSSSSNRSRRSSRKSNNIWSYTMRGFRKE